MLFVDVATTSLVVSNTSSRTAKRDALADLLARLDADEVEPTVGFLTGEARQGRIGVGWATLAGLDSSPPADQSSDQPSLTVTAVDEVLTRLAATTGPGSVAARQAILSGLFERATAIEATFLATLLGGELRQGALGGVMTDAVAKAAGLPAALVRRATLLGGRLDHTARLALHGGRDAVAAIGLEVGQPLQPMLASTAPSASDAVTEIGESSVEWKLDGIRIQVHRDGDDIHVYTRNLNEITDRVPGVVAAVRSLAADQLVLDGEALSVDAIGRPRLFQDTVSWRGRNETEPPAGGEPSGASPSTGAGPEPDGIDRPGARSPEPLATPPDELRPFFFDLVHIDGRDLIDEPLVTRRAALAAVAPTWVIPGTITSDPVTAEAVLAESLAAGHEGVVVKGVDSTYEAGRRGKAWRKVKPVHTLDLVVLAVEWGHGRRAGLLSNLHLGARCDDGTLVMVGKTFKGLTDELLRWQTERFTGLAEREDNGDGRSQTGTVWVRPEQLVEIAVDGVQRSTRYPGGVALRFARVLRYRHDKASTEADTIETVQALLIGPSDPG
ncbi:MAG: ATP-dependent DNA ligase [Aquihabitans sp.]